MQLQEQVQEKDFLISNQDQSLKAKNKNLQAAEE